MPKISASAGATYAPGTEPENAPAPAASEQATGVAGGVAGVEQATGEPHADNAPAGAQSDEDAAVDVNGDGQLDHYETAAKADLVTEAARRGLATSGSKADLVKRLQDNDAAAAAASPAAATPAPTETHQ